MANDGTKIVLTLKQVNSVTFAPTGLTENNIPGTSEYIPPHTDLVACPVSYSLACAVPVFQGYTGSIGFEFSLFDSVVMNPKVTQVVVDAYITGSHSLIGSTVFSIPHTSTPNYFSGSMSISFPGSYYTDIQYWSGSAVIGTCTYSSSLITTH